MESPTEVLVNLVLGYATQPLRAELQRQTEEIAALKAQLAAEPPPPQPPPSVPPC